MFQLAKLFWDIGGALGLFLGCSALSIIELIELAMDSMVILCHKLTRKNKPKIIRNNKVFNRRSSKYAIFDETSSEEDLSKDGPTKGRRRTRRNMNMLDAVRQLNHVREESDTQLKPMKPIKQSNEVLNTSRERIMQET